jgi:tetratricopeptide (TPR) repeat protein
MLFDLRGRGRRRAVKAIYLSLAVLMGGGLVFFGIGGATSGGLFDAFDQSDSSSAGDDVVQQRLERAQTAVEANPRDAAAWAALADVRFQTANSAENYNSTSGTYTPAGERILRQARDAWDRHVALAGDDVNTEVANKMAIALGQNGLKDYEGAVAALEAVIDGEKPTAARYAQLAILAELAGQTRKSTLAEDRAVELAPAAQRKDVRAQIQLGKQQAQQAQPEPVGG